MTHRHLLSAVQCLSSGQAVVVELRSDVSSDIRHLMYMAKHRRVVLPEESVTLINDLKNGQVSSETVRLHLVAGEHWDPQWFAGRLWKHVVSVQPGQ